MHEKDWFQNFRTQSEHFKSNYSVSWMQLHSKISLLFNGEYHTPKVTNIADASNDANSDKKFYFDLADTPFKKRYRNHTKPFKHESYENRPEFPKYI